MHMYVHRPNWKYISTADNGLEFAYDAVLSESGESSRILALQWWQYHSAHNYGVFVAVLGCPKQGGEGEERITANSVLAGFRLATLTCYMCTYGLS